MRRVIGLIAIVLMVLAVILGLVSMFNVYQYEWRNRFAWSHLDLAEASSDIGTQYVEVSKAVVIMDTFPKQGNWDFWNKQNPKTNMAMAWQALYELQNYTFHTSTLNRSDASYNIAVYNNQEKIQYFQEQFSGAFSEYLIWGANGWFGGLGVLLGGFSVLFFTIVILLSIDDDAGTETLAWFLSTIPFWIFSIFFMVVSVSPIFYGGPT